MDPKTFAKNAAGRLVRSVQGNYWAFVPNALPPRLSWTSDLVTSLSDADRALGELAGLGRAIPNPHLLIVPFVRREAVLSSRIEGTQASLADLYAYEAAPPASSKSPSDVGEVLNYVWALEHGLARLREFPLSLRLLREIHARLMEGVRGESQTPGEFRRSQNWIGTPGCTLNSASFVPPPVPEMKQALHALEEYLQAPPTLPPLVRLGLIHYQFEAIHPFLDGNGRIGRLLVTLLLCRWDLLPEPLLYLSAYLEAHRQTYYDLLLAVSQQGAWEPWLIFFLRGVASQAQDAVARAQQIQDLRERYREQVQAASGASGLLQLVDLLFTRPLVTIRQVESGLGTTYQTARRYVSQLEEWGMLHEITGQGRNRVYRAGEVMQLLESPFE